MKNKLIKTCVVLLISILFVSCGISAANDPEPIDIDNEPFLESGTPKPDNSKEISLSIVKTPAMLFDNTISSSNGLYKLRIDHGGTSVLYYDYSTMSLNYLSNQLIATSSDENPGWIPSNEGGTVPTINGDYLYVVTVGLRSVGGSGAEPAKVFQMTLDGSNRKELTLPQSMLLDQNSGIAADKDGIYLLMDTYDAEERAYGDFILLYVNSKMEKAEEIARFPNDVFALNLYGAVGKELIFRVARPQEGYEEASRNEQFMHLRYTYVSYDVEAHSERQLIQYNQGEYSISYDYGNNLYYCKVGENDIHRIDIASKNDEIALRADDILSLTGKETVRVYDPIIDDKIGIITSVNEPYEVHQYYYDLTTGDLYEPDMVFYEDDVEHPVRITAETVDRFVVINGYIYYTEIDTIDGLPAETTRIEKYFSMIDKDDYWKNEPNYRSFTDYVYPSDAEIKSQYSHKAQGSGY